VKTCESCRYCTELPTGEATSANFCTRNPPAVFLTRDGDNITSTCAYPPIARVACGQFARRWWWQ